MRSQTLSTRWQVLSTYPKTSRWTANQRMNWSENIYVKNLRWKETLVKIGPLRKKLKRAKHAESFCWKDLSLIEMSELCWQYFSVNFWKYWAETLRLFFAWMFGWIIYLFLIYNFRCRRQYFLVSGTFGKPRDASLVFFRGWGCDIRWH